VGWNEDFGMNGTEKVLVVGAGISGLGVALALGDGKREVTILDRDPPPPGGSPEEAFNTWERRGATQLRHSHVFLGRLTTLIRERYPKLLQELLDAGARVFTFQDALPPALKDSYVFAEGDEELSILFSRRTTLELVMRRHAAHLPNVKFVTDAGVRGLIAHRDNGTLVVDGVTVERNGGLEEMRADIVIDSSGRNTIFPDWIRTNGVEVGEEESPAGILYFTRHYRLRDGMDEPPRDNTPAAGDLGYIKFGVFAADNRHFSVTLATPEIETGLRMAIVKPDVFDAICASIPGCARWTDPARSEPASPVYSMGNLKSVWRSYFKNDAPQVLNFFAVGDAAVRTNPLYGRGCSAGVVHAHILRAAMDATPEPRERAIIVEKRTREELRPYYDSMVKQDIQAIRRAEQERDPAYKPKLKSRLLKSFIEDALLPATRADLTVLRASSRAFHMISDPTDWLKRPATVARILRLWPMSKARKIASGYYPPEFGPKRGEMLARLGIPY
jgi:2-polyprenyl-6-methoxyphenol hydroxylase-like FAD-dependent oxidoreductase